MMLMHKIQTNKQSRSKWQLLTAVFGLIGYCVYGVPASLAQLEQASPVIEITGPNAVIDLTHLIHRSADTESESNDYPQGQGYFVDIVNRTPEEANRLLIFSFPLLIKSSPWGPSIDRPHVADIQILEGEASLEILPVRSGQAYGAAQIRIPASESIRIGFSHEGSIDGAGIFLWQPASFNDFEAYRTWSNGIFLGIISVLAAFGFGVALITWVPRSGSLLALLVTAWTFEFVTLSTEVAGYWRPLCLAMFGLAGVLFVRANFQFSGLALSLRRAITVMTGALFVTMALSLFKLPVAMFLARLEVLLIGLTVAMLLTPLGRKWGEIDRTNRFGLWALIFSGALTAILPLFEWQAAGLVIEPLLHGSFMVALCLLVFPAILGMRQIEPVPESAVRARSTPVIEPAEVSFSGDDRYALGVAASHQGLWDWTIEGDQLYLSSSIDGLLGVAAGGLKRSEIEWAKRVHPDDLERYRNALRSYIERGNVSFNLEFRMRHEDGSYPWFLLRATCLPGEDGLAIRCVGVISDITPTRMLQERLAHNATRDTLTELPNRQVLLEKITSTLEGHTGKPPSLLVIDLDRFKTINDGLGHAMGDLLLQILARRLETTIGPSDLVARIGSDEFGVLLVHGRADQGEGPAVRAGGPDAEELADYILDLVAQPVELEGAEIFPMASIGIAASLDRHETAEHLLKDAEIAMFRAKSAGGSRYVVFQEHMGKSSNEALSLETDLRRALQRQQIEVLYQPIMNLTDGSIAGFEALMRWRHGTHGLMVPDQFVAMAEETDMIVPMGRFALSMASLQLSQWQSMFPLAKALFVSVNVSSRQLGRDDFANDIEEVLNHAQIQPGTLKLEVTESLIMKDPQKAEELLNAAKQLGAGISLDDFGTGFASLSNLQKYPFDTIKVDRSFVSTMESKSDSTVIVNSIVDLANDLGLIVIAEGLETEDDALLLKQMGCKFGQGYVFGAPMSAEEAQTFIAHHWRGEKI
jgi:diguanylate cyclase (GGDEF)-like protein/PAS domain S-box-containing protein